MAVLPHYTDGDEPWSRLPERDSEPAPVVSEATGPLEEFLAGLRVLTDRWNDRQGQLASSTRISPEWVAVPGATGRSGTVRRGAKTVVMVVLRDERAGAREAGD